jgi:AcrR family transcriptional regulator
VPRIVDHDARRAELLDGAFELFAERGWSALTMRGIAKELGVSTGTLYHYFDGKVAMARGMYARRVGRDVAVAYEMIPEDAEPLVAAAATASFVVERADDLQRSLLVGLDFSRQEGDDIQQIIVENIEAYRTVLRERLGLSATEASTVLSYLFGIFIHRHLDPSAVDLGAQLQALAGFLVPANSA